MVKLMRGEISMKFFEYDFSLFKDGSIKFNELEADKLGLVTGDAFVTIVDPNTQEPTLKRIELDKVESITME